MYKDAIARYIDTIGYLNPSYVIQKFLDAKQIDYLIDYLETLTQRARAFSFHSLAEDAQLMDSHNLFMALLLNCYIRRSKEQGGKKSKVDLIQLISSPGFEQKQFDIESIIEACRSVGDIKTASRLAKKTKDLDQRLNILINDKKKYKKALELISAKMGPKSRMNSLKMYGSKLIAEFPDETYVVIKEFTKELIQIAQKSPKDKEEVRMHIKSLQEMLVDSKDLTEDFLDFQIRVNPNCGSEVYHSLIELYAANYEASCEYEMSHTSTLSKDKTPSNILLETQLNTLLKFLQEHYDEYDKKHALMVCEMHHIDEGTELLCKMMNLKNELMAHYMQRKKHQELINLCKDCGEVEQNLWIQTLTFLVNELNDNKGNGPIQDYIKEVLECIDKLPAISPLLVLEIIYNCESLQFSIVKDYMASKMKKLQKKIEKNREIVNDLSSDIEDLRKSIKGLRTTAQMFQVKECQECGKKITPPLIQFMCNHAFHDYCIPASDFLSKDCPKCAPRNSQLTERKAQLKLQAENPEMFFKELKEHPLKFDVISKYFGRSLFDESPLESINEEAKEDNCLC
eukprot:TRINITY_DN11101_c0_g1_i9.p1 TRINITY_DN11101_c0_g1~~TRINITY_DN11101_c0_g1_i9.p1  ORF type:complete len:569 (-),score=157.60 TRINITY_DN11101_c0_g1_i9:137-1843(-)